MFVAQSAVALEVDARGASATPAGSRLRRSNQRRIRAEAQVANEKSDRPGAILFDEIGYWSEVKLDSSGGTLGLRQDPLEEALA